MLNNPYRKAVNAAGAVIGLATLVGTGVAAHQADNLRSHLASAPNHGLTDGEFRVETECLEAAFCPIRTLSIDVRGGQIAGIDVGYHTVNRQSHSRNTRAVRTLSEAAIQAQSADGLQMISGATVTSQMFQQSLQAAINMAQQ